MEQKVVYRDRVLAKGSLALELWENWQKETKNKDQLKKKLDMHMDDVERRYQDLLKK